jgi:formate dehydrogenase major subunit
MLDAAVEGTFKGLYCQGEDILQSDPDTKHVAAGLAAMDCVIVHDLFLNETANYAHVFLPGSSFLEKDGTFTNAERRINRVRKVMAPQERLRRLGGDADAGQRPAGRRATARAGPTPIPARSWTRSPATTPSFAGVSYERLEELGSVQWPCNEANPAGTPLMHVEGFVRGKGRFIRTDYVPTDERTGPRFPLLLTTGRILSQYNVGAQTRRTANVAWHDEDVLEIHPHDAESARRQGRRLGAARLAFRRHLAARPRSPTGCRRAWSTPPSTTPTRRPTSSPPTTPTGRPTARNTR